MVSIPNCSPIKWYLFPTVLLINGIYSQLFSYKMVFIPNCSPNKWYLFPTILLLNGIYSQLFSFKMVLIPNCSPIKLYLSSAALLCMVCWKPWPWPWPWPCFQGSAKRSVTAKNLLSSFCKTLCTISDQWKGKQIGLWTGVQRRNF